MNSIVDEFLSLNNFHKAWLKVAENQGSAGVDHETIDIFRRNEQVNIAQLKEAVTVGTYQAYPCKQVLIPKKATGFRELRIPTVRDRIVQQALLNVIYPLVEPRFSPASFAYRPNLSYVDAVKKVAEWRDLGYQWVLDADIVKFFDNIEHTRLMKECRIYIEHSGLLCLIKTWISTGILTDEGLRFPDKGIPQGAVISPVLANIYLNEFDWLIEASDLKLVRYADDFVVLAKTQDRLLQACLEVEQILHSMALEIHPRKTQLTTFNQGFRFLGHGFLGKAIFPLEGDNDVEGNNTQKKNPESQKESLIAEVSSPSNLLALDREQSQEQCLLNYPNKLIWNPEMATIYLTEQGTNLHKDHLRFIVYTPSQKRLEVMIKEVKMILVYGNIQLTTAVISTCLENDIMILYLSQSGNYKGHLWSLTSTNLDNEAVQLQKHQQHEFQSPVTRAIILGKLLNSKHLLMRLNRKRKVADVEKAIMGLNCDIQALQNTDDIDTLRGYEGVGAARYFPAFGHLITNSDFSFSQRVRQPPSDPVNSLLSFGYTVLFNNVFSLIIAEGLSPYLGNLHYGEHKKPYLAFDLMEEFRSPIVDSMVLRVLNNNIFKLSDFETAVTNGGVYLRETARRVFFKQFENRLNEEISHPDLQSPATYRQAIQLQIKRYKRCLLASIPYEGFVRAV